MTKRKTVQLGDKARCMVTGFTGIVTSKVEYLNGCKQFCIRPAVGADGKMPEGEYIDIQQVELVEANPIGFKSSDTGGPQRDTPKR